MRVGLSAAALPGLLLTLAGCFGAPAPPPEHVRVVCPHVLVSLDLPERPAEPRWGEDELVALAVVAVGLGRYADALEEQAAKREAQHAECREITN